MADEERDDTEGEFSEEGTLNDNLFLDEEPAESGDLSEDSLRYSFSIKEEELE